MKTKILIAAALLVCLCAACRSRSGAKGQDSPCEGNFSGETFQSIMEQLDLKNEECHCDFVSQQAISGETGLSVWLIPQVTDSETDEYDNSSFSLDCRVLLVDNETEKIVSRYDEPYIFDSDAYRLMGLSIDTVFYGLSDKVSAFAVNASYASGSRVNSTGNTSASLFIRQGDMLKKILDYEIHQYQTESGAEDAYYHNSVREKLIISDKKTNGLHDILFRIDSTHTNYIKVGDDLEEETAIETDFRFFRYNGSEYKEGAADNSVIYEKYEVEIGESEEYFYFGKTLNQVYEILKNKESVFKNDLMPELPEEETRYETEEGEYTYKVSYFPDENGSWWIWIEGDYGGTTLHITEKAKFTSLTIANTD